MDLPLLKNGLTPLAKNILVPLGLTAVASATDVAIQKKTFVSRTATLVFSNEELNDIMKIVKSHEESGLLIEGVSQTGENEIMEEKGRFLDMLAAMLAATLLGSALTGIGVVKGSDGVIRADEGVIRTGEGQRF